MNYLFAIIGIIQLLIIGVYISRKFKKHGLNFTVIIICTICMFYLLVPIVYMLFCKKYAFQTHYIKSLNLYSYEEIFFNFLIIIILLGIFIIFNKLFKEVMVSKSNLHIKYNEEEYKNKELKKIYNTISIQIVDKIAILTFIKWLFSFL